jgi:hypothetical protein
MEDFNSKIYFNAETNELNAEEIILCFIDKIRFSRIYNDSTIFSSYFASTSKIIDKEKNYL